MSLLDTWILVTSSVWSAIAPDPELDAPQPWHYPYANARTGYHKASGGKEVYCVLGTQEQIQALVDALEAHTVGSTGNIYAWTQGDGLDSLEQWPTDPAGVLALMKDHVTYDQDGNPIGSTPATLEAPNWGFVFLGQKERIFAGGFSSGFSEGFK